MPIAGAAIVHPQEYFDLTGLSHRLSVFLVVIAASWASTANDLEQLHPGSAEFIARVSAEHRLDAAMVADLLRQAAVREDILQAMRRPAEALPWSRYRPIFMTEERAAGGVEFFAENRATLAEAERKYGVPVHVITAIIGVETYYGRITGKHRVLDALVTLGFHYPPRASFFAGELEHYLLLAAEQNLPPTEVQGSYAGAMGLGQFIPSSYRSYAVDGDQDGSIDLWRSIPDAVHSVANYLAVHGWQTGEPVAQQVAPTADARTLDKQPLKPEFPVQQFVEWGYAPDATIERDRLATLIELDGAEGTEHWLGFANFYVISRYNHSALYSMAVHQLARELRDRGVAVDVSAE